MRKAGVAVSGRGKTGFMSKAARRPALGLAHATLAARDLDKIIDFYCEVLGFHVTNRGPVPDGELVFLSQDPNEHHQLAVVGGQAVGEHGFMMVDHLAFRTGSLEDLRQIRTALLDAKIDPILPICHGNAWSLYFDDCEGNGIECFVDTPFHVAQPFAVGFDLDLDDETLTAWTREQVESEPEFRPMGDWKAEFSKKLG